MLRTNSTYPDSVVNVIATPVAMGTTARATTMSVFLERQAAQQEAAMKADLQQRQRDIQEAIENELESFYDSDSEEDEEEDDEDNGGNRGRVHDNQRGRLEELQDNHGNRHHHDDDDDEQLSESSNNSDDGGLGVHRLAPPHKPQQQQHHHHHRRQHPILGDTAVDNLAEQVRPPIEGSSIDDDDDGGGHLDDDDENDDPDNVDEDVDDDQESRDDDRDVGRITATSGRVVAFAIPPTQQAAAANAAALVAAYPLTLRPEEHPARYLVLQTEATSRSTAQLATLSPETTGCGLSSVDYSTSLHQPPQQLLGSNRNYPPENILPPRPAAVQRVSVGVSVVPENQRDLDQLDILYRARGHHIEELKAQLLELQESSGRETRLMKHKLALAEANRESLEKAKESVDSRLAAAHAQIRELQSESDKRQELSARLLTENEQLRQNLETAVSQSEALSAQLADLNTAGTIGRVRDQQENFIQSLRNKKDEEIYFLRDRIDRLSAEAEARQAELESARAAAAQQRAQDSAQLLQANELAASITQQLRDSQRCCQELLAGSATEEVAGLRQQLAQREVAKTITDEMNAALQEEISDLREQMALYEAAERLGVLVLRPRSPAPVEGNNNLPDRETTSTSMPNVGPLAADRGDKGGACLKAELLRCQGLYKQKREKVTELQKELIQLKKASYEGRLRYERAELALTEHKERLVSMETRLKATQKRLDEATEPGAAEVRLRRQLEAANEQKSMLEEELDNSKRQAHASTESARHLAEQLAQLQADFASAWERAEREKREDFERIQRTCQEHFELCRERMREELLASFAAEKRQLVGEHDRRTAEMQALVAQLGEERRDLEAQLQAAAKTKPSPPPPPLLPVVVRAEKHSASCQTDSPPAFEIAPAYSTPAANYPLDPLAEQETELGRRLQECYLSAISRIRDEVVNHVTESQERSERRVRRAQRNVCARFALHLRRSLEDKFGCEDSQLSVDSVVQLLNQSLNHTLNRSHASASHASHNLRRSATITAAAPSASIPAAAAGSYWDDSTATNSGHSSPSGAAAAVVAPTPVAPPRPARTARSGSSALAQLAGHSAAATSTPAEKDSAAAATAAGKV